MAARRPTREDVLAAVGEQFPDHDAATVLALLDRYGTRRPEPERERVQLAVLKLSGGDIEKLRHNLEVARQDYRDVLYWAEYPDHST
jgi:hypothetical protein